MKKPRKETHRLKISVGELTVERIVDQVHVHLLLDRKYREIVTDVIQVDKESIVKMKPVHVVYWPKAPQEG